MVKENLIIELENYIKIFDKYNNNNNAEKKISIFESDLRNNFYNLKKSILNNYNRSDGDIIDGFNKKKTIGKYTLNDFLLRDNKKDFDFGEALALRDFASDVLQRDKLWVSQFRPELLSDKPLIKSYSYESFVKTCFDNQFNPITRNPNFKAFLEVLSVDYPNGLIGEDLVLLFFNLLRMECLDLASFELFLKNCISLSKQINSQELINSFFSKVIGSQILVYCCEKKISIKALNDFMNLYLLNENVCEPVRFFSKFYIYSNSFFKSYKVDSDMDYSVQCKLIFDLSEKFDFLTLGVFYLFDSKTFNPIFYSKDFSSNSLFDRFSSGLKRALLKPSSTNTSDMIYFSKNLKHIIKVYDKKYFDVWQKAYLLNWGNFGFDYVPIEPILRNYDSQIANGILNNLDSKHEIDPLALDKVLVYTKLVGISILTLINKFPEIYQLEWKRIHDFADEMSNTLRGCGIYQNDYAYRNICIDLETRRLYLIDFGMARYVAHLDNLDKHIIKLSA